MRTLCGYYPVSFESFLKYFIWRSDPCATPRNYWKLSQQSATELLRLCTQIGSFQRTKECTTLPLPSIQSWGVCCFLQVARTVAQTLHGGDGGGKALFSSFKVGYSSKSLFRAVSQLILSQLKIGSPTWITWCNSTRHRSTYQLTTKYTTIPRRLGEYHGYKPRRFTSWYTYMRQES